MRIINILIITITIFAINGCVAYVPRVAYAPVRIGHHDSHDYRPHHDYRPVRDYQYDFYRR